MPALHIIVFYLFCNRISVHYFECNSTYILQPSNATSQLLYMYKITLLKIPLLHIHLCMHMIRRSTFTVGRPSIPASRPLGIMPECVLVTVPKEGALTELPALLPALTIFFGRLSSDWVRFWDAMNNLKETTEYVGFTMYSFFRWFDAFSYYSIDSSIAITIDARTSNSGFMVRVRSLTSVVQPLTNSIQISSSLASKRCSGRLSNSSLTPILLWPA